MDLQRDALHKAGCDRIYEETASGSRTDRPGLARALENLRPGDTFVIWKLDRLGRSLKHLIEVVQDLADQNVDFVSVRDGIDTTTPTGKLIFHIVGAIGQFERDLIRERTIAGLEAARARGHYGGRPKALSPRQVRQAALMAQQPEWTIKDICVELGISRATYYLHVHPVLTQCADVG